MRVSAQIKHTSSMAKVVAQRKAAMSDGMDKALVLNANRVRNNAINLLKTITPGEKVTRYGGAKGKRTVTVSKPGDAPNPDTKLAVKSVLMEYDKSDKVARVGTNLIYLAALEFVSRTTKRDARPWLRPAWREWYKKHGRNFLKDMGLRRGK